MKHPVIPTVDDPDEVNEAAQLAALKIDKNAAAAAEPSNGPKCPFNHGAEPDLVRLNVIGSTHYKSDDTAGLLEEVGGAQKLTEMTALFYSRMFADPHLDQFVRDHDDPHAERLADWICEKMGGGDIWTQKRATRPHKEVVLAGGHRHVVHDRSSAHAAAWYSPKRAPRDVGEHFKLNDARVWLRLMFWSARDVGLLNNARFSDWYQRFLGHFVRIYESKAVQFIRDSARWSADPKNTQAYINAGNKMPQVHVSYQTALKDLPKEELGQSSAWPYDQE